MAIRLAIAAVVAAFLGIPLPAIAQQYPNKPIKWIVAYPPGGGSDLVARTVAQSLSGALGQQVVVENRPGAATIIGAEAAAKAPADGYTLFTGDNGSLVFNPALYAKLPYDAGRDFAPIGMIARFPLMLVINPRLYKVSTVREFIDLAKREPGRINYASPGAGSPHHLAMELLRHQTGIDVTHVPYKGAGPALQDLLGGQIGAMFLDLATGGQHVRSGKLHALGIADAKRNPTLPVLATFGEQGFVDFVVFAWQGVFVPTGVPAEIVSRLSQEVAQAVRSPEVRKRFLDAGVDPVTSTPQELSELVRSDTARWHPIIRTRGIRIE